ncbi:MAG TPA: hypothetical protein DCY40_00655 [Actinobacteria bacterium]|nr:hypothetical protein [Actinomycetota bacterium]
MRRIIAPSLTLLVLLAACGGGVAITSTVAPTTATTTTAPPTTTTTAPPTTTTTTLPAALDELVWSRVPHDAALLGDASMSTVVAGGPGLLAFGSGGGDSDLVVWASADGIAWTMLGMGAVDSEGPVWLHDAVVGGPGLVAVGAKPATEDFDVIVWTSTDGDSWVEVPDETGARSGSGDQAAFSLAVGGPGLVAVGYEEYEDEMDGAVWTSPDGITWTRVPDGLGVFGGPGDQRIFAVTVGGPGLVAVGEEFRDDALGIAVWVSPDGFAWTRVPDDAGVLSGLGEYSAFSVVAGGPGLVMVGRVSAGEIGSDGAAWWSTDGSTWVRGDPDGALTGPGNQTLVSVVAAGNGLVAAGRDDSLGEEDAAVWMSTDGITWVDVSTDPAVFGGQYSQYVAGMTVWDSGIVIVGWEQSASHSSAVIWVGMPRAG